MYGIGNIGLTGVHVICFPLDVLYGSNNVWGDTLVSILQSHSGELGNEQVVWLEGCNMKYKVVLQESEEGFSVSCPGLPGCWSQGETEEEALENIQDAIQEYLAAKEEVE